MSTHRGIRILCLAAGLIFVGLAGLGVALPILPTTPFLLVAAACFAKSSERMTAWLLGNRWFGPYLARYRLHKAITQRDRVLSLLLLWCGLAGSAVFATEQWWLRGLLFAIGVAVTVHLAMLDTWSGESRD